LLIQYIIFTEITAMDITEIIILVGIVFLFIYIVLRGIHKKTLSSRIDHPGFSAHSFANSHSLYETPSSFLPRIRQSLGAIFAPGLSRNREGLEEVYPDNKTAFNDPDNLPLKEYAIFSSFNSAYNGSANTIEQLGKVMYNGCRFLDFNIFHSEDNLYVGYSRDNMPVMVDTSLPLSKVIEYINAYAFSLDKDIEMKEQQSTQMRIVKDIISPGSSNSTTIQQSYTKYPLIINFRVYRPPKSTLDIVDKLYTEVSGKYGFKNLHAENGVAIPITRYTPLKSLTKKVIITMDYQNILQIYSGQPPYDISNVDPATMETVRKFSNIMMGEGSFGAFYSYADVDKNTNQMLMIMDTKMSINHSYETNTNTMKLAYPSYSDDVANPDSYKYIQNYKIQMIPVRFYINDLQLEKYIKLFSDNKRPFLPLYNAKSYILQPSNTPPPT
jgi:hypothetical protein